MLGSVVTGGRPAIREAACLDRVRRDRTEARTMARITATKAGRQDAGEIGLSEIVMGPLQDAVLRAVRDGKWAEAVERNPSLRSTDRQEIEREAHDRWGFGRLATVAEALGVQATLVVEDERPTEAPRTMAIARVGDGVQHAHGCPQSSTEISRVEPSPMKREGGLVGLVRDLVIGAHPAMVAIAAEEAATPFGILVSATAMEVGVPLARVQVARPNDPAALLMAAWRGSNDGDLDLIAAPESLAA